MTKSHGIILALFCVISCSKAPSHTIPELPNSLLTQEAKLRDFAIEIPSYGISAGDSPNQQFEVNIEAEDTNQVQVGQSAMVFQIPQRQGIPCRVSKVLRNVSTETGQSLAWLIPLTRANNIRPAQFVYATITTSIRKRALLVPKKAVLIRQGKTWVIRESPPEKKGANPDEESRKFTAVTVQLGESTESEVEITEGLKPGDSVVVQDAIGFLYPDFKLSEE